ncbi:MAG: arginine--tRNA ligase [Bacteroidota bacterium]|nr:arginine--tRNA ligase [Bacteroidota bacterium]
MSVESIVQKGVSDAIKALYGADVNEDQVQLQETRKDFTGDITVVTFPFLKISKKKPVETGEEIGAYLKENVTYVDNVSVVQGFLNIEISRDYWLSSLSSIIRDENYGYAKPESTGHTIMVEYSSPNTNKPLHLGHVRNNLLGYSVSNLLKACGHRVIMVNLVNDRGIHICKSMLAWQKFGEGITPESSGKKGDHLVGDFYVIFDKEYKKQIKELIAEGKTEEEATKTAPLILEAQEMLRKWEAKDAEVVALWEMMNSWVYGGFDETYKKMGVGFDRIYHESQTYLSGKAIVQKGLEDKILYQRPDNSVWADLTGDGLDEKLLLRSDGTSVYMTQDLGTACQRVEEYKADQMIYVVGNEQNYHFQVLSLVLQKLGYSWASQIKHMSYGMVELPSGKMKSREGTVVDADDLMDEMIGTAEAMSNELGKLDGYTEEEKKNIFRIIGLGALKYFILKVDPKKNMLFDPKESVDFNGNTGPFIQYTYTRIRSIMRKADEMGIVVTDEVSSDVQVDNKEKQLIKLIYRYPSVIQDAGDTLSPALVANYVYELAKEFNQFYHDFTILKEENTDIRNLRLILAKVTGSIIQSGMALLGIEVPERM